MVRPILQDLRQAYAQAGALRIHGNYYGDDGSYGSNAKVTQPGCQAHDTHHLAQDCRRHL
jgi:hypothetical protein